MLIDLINNINNIFNNIPSNLLNLLDFDFDLYNKIKNNQNIINNKLNIYDFIDITSFINKILNTINNIDNNNDYKLYIQTAIYQIKNLLIKEYSSKFIKDILLYFHNANDSEICNLFELLDYIDLTYKDEFLKILYEKIHEINHVYYIFKKNYNYENYFKYLLKFKNQSISLTPSIMDKFNFINNNDFDINKIKIKKDMYNIISKNDFYSIINKSINNDDILKNILQNNFLKKNNNTLNPNNIINYKDNIETFLFNYNYYYKVIKKSHIKINDKNKIIIKTSVYQYI